MFSFFRQLFKKPLSVETICFLRRQSGWRGPLHVLSYGAAFERLQDGQIRMFYPGAYNDLLSGDGCILARGKLLAVLRKRCGSTITVSPASLAPVTGFHFPKYWEIKPHQEVTPTNIESLAGVTGTAWHFRGGDLFVSEDVAAALLQAEVGPVHFENGFSGWMPYPPGSPPEVIEKHEQRVKEMARLRDSIDQQNSTQ